MDFAFTSEQDQLRDTVARLIRQQYDFETRRKIAKSAEGWRPQMWSQFAELGLLGAGFSRHGGSAAQKEEHIAGPIGGENRYAFAYSEPKSRFDLNDVSTTAKKSGAGYTLNGHKAVVMGAPFATHL